MELVKDYDRTIYYYMGKANIMVDAFSGKVVSIGNLAYLGC